MSAVPSTQEFVTTEETTDARQGGDPDRAVADLRTERAANPRRCRLPARAAVRRGVGSGRRRSSSSFRPSSLRAAVRGDYLRGLPCSRRRDGKGRLEGEAGLRHCGIAGRGGRIVYQPLLNKRGTDRETADGFMVAMDAETGEELWRFKAGPVESSPLLYEGVLYFGTFDQNLYALDAETGERLWAFQADGRVKGAPAFWRGTIFTGAYGGNVYAVDAATGSSSGRARGREGSRGPATSMPGRRSRTGASTSATRTGRSTRSAPIWGSPLVALDGRLRLLVGGGERPDVYIGSYDHNFYALDAATGDVRWTFDAGGAISGASPHAGPRLLLDVREKTSAPTPSRARSSGSSTTASTRPSSPTRSVRTSSGARPSTRSRAAEHPRRPAGPRPRRLAERHDAPEGDARSPLRACDPERVVLHPAALGPARRAELGGRGHRRPGADRARPRVGRDAGGRARAAAGGRRFADVIDAVYRGYAEARGKRRYGDKTPSYMQHLGLLDRVFPGARYVHIVRDGRDAASRSWR